MVDSNASPTLGLFVDQRGSRECLTFFLVGLLALLFSHCYVSARNLMLCRGVFLLRLPRLRIDFSRGIFPGMVAFNRERNTLPC